MAGSRTLVRDPAISRTASDVISVRSLWRVACSSHARACIARHSILGPRGPLEVSLVMSFDPARDDSDLPDVDDRLVEPGTRYEMLDGELVYVPPCDEPHGERHSQLCALLGAHAGAEFKVAADMLTRTSKIDDIAPDASIYPAARHPKTGRRQLDHLSFELVSTETLGYAARKAAKLAGRGVRRVFAIDIERSRALEWSVALGAWSVLDAAGHIVDPALAVPLPIKALIHSMKADDTIARALIAKCNPVIAANDAEARAEGKA